MPGRPVPKSSQGIGLARDLVGSRIFQNLRHVRENVVRGLGRTGVAK